MKKFLISITLLCYLAITSGVMVNFHYCMNRLDSTHVFAGKTDKCAKCGMHTDDAGGCCRDEVVLIKLSDDQRSGSAFVYDLPLLTAVINTPSEFICSSFYNTPTAELYTTHSPPILGGQDIYLTNCVFRI